MTGPTSMNSRAVDDPCRPRSTSDKLPDHESSWELVYNLTRQFLEFHLEDQVNLKEGNNDTIPLLTYKRHKKGACVQHVNGTISTT